MISRSYNKEPTTTQEKVSMESYQANSGVVSIKADRPPNRPETVQGGPGVEADSTCERPDPRSKRGRYDKPANIDKYPWSTTYKPAGDGTCPWMFCRNIFCRAERRWPVEFIGIARQSVMGFAWWNKGRPSIYECRACGKLFDTVRLLEDHLPGGKKECRRRHQDYGLWGHFALVECAICGGLVEFTRERLAPHFLKFHGILPDKAYYDKYIAGHHKIALQKRKIVVNGEERETTVGVLSGPEPFDIVQEKEEAKQEK